MRSLGSSFLEPASYRPPLRRLRIALVNNMPDAALAATERQFAGLLAEAAGDAFEISLRFYALSGVPRGEAARAAMQGAYEPLEALQAAGADALIVTGAEPSAAELSDEPYWPELAALIDWAKSGAVRSALFSCLAAHAAVLHLDGIRRRRLDAKATGVFAFQRVAEGPLTRGFEPVVRLPHSRLNGVSAPELAARGYQILTSSEEAGVDLFMRQDGCVLVFLQGHPEYDPDSLLREYRRDIGRFLRGERSYPPRPSGYFAPDVEAELEAVTERARRTQNPGPMLACDRIAAHFRPEASWRGHAVRLYRNWLDLVAGAGVRTDVESAAGCARAPALPG
jgi:homoserine O-succinyltransferase